MIGIVIAACSTFAATQLGAPALDGVASILIGVVVGDTAGLLARESKSLLIGEWADQRLTESILDIAESASPGSKVNGVLPVQLAPHQILAALSLEFADALRVPQVEAAVVEVERQIRAAHAEVVTLFIKPQTGTVFKETARLGVGGLPMAAGVKAAGTAISASPDLDSTKIADR